ncbi:MAG TPA: low affinity iron permease family protein [Candidatus Limnocylindria bacterium]|nr:low affinity iron permease family protein [Candidatus Limnocylindria bacterium]
MKASVGRRAEAAAVAEERVDEAVQRTSPFKAWFGHVATKVSDVTGSVWAFTVALLVILTWIVTGPMFGFSDTWQLVINTGTTIVTFLMVFLIQNTQNRDAKATELKLDELIRAIGQARNRFIGAELEPEELLEREKKEIEAEKDKPSPAPHQVHPPAHNGKPHDHGPGPAGRR